jgi:hypothetical protein
MIRAPLTGAFIQDSRGGVAIEFVAILPAFLLLTFFVMDVAVAMLLIGTVEKAAQLGARLAIVSDYAVAGLPPARKNSVNAGFVPGDNCNIAVSASLDPCTRFNGGNPLICIGGEGDDCEEGFDVIFARMDRLASILERTNVTIAYEYIGLGFADGPIVPRVTVSVQGVPYNTVSSQLLDGLYGLLTGDADADFPGLTTMPTITATFTGEDLSSAGA